MTEEKNNIEERADIQAEEVVEEKCDCIELENKYKRALADYQNLLKQTIREKEEFAKYANENLLQDILPIYDNLKISLNHAGEGIADGLIEGIKHVVRQFADVLKNIGVEEVKTVGEKFDHHTMEAIDKEATDEEEKDGVVSKEMMAGYKLKDRVIRVAKVVVYKYESHNLPTGRQAHNA